MKDEDELNQLKALKAINPPSYYDNHLYSDVSILGNDGYMRAHRLILAAACPLLKEVLLSAGDMSESEMGVINFPDFTTDDIEDFLSVVYGRQQEEVTDKQREMLQLCGFPFLENRDDSEEQDNPDISSDMLDASTADHDYDHDAEMDIKPTLVQSSKDKPATANITIVRTDSLAPPTAKQPEVSEPESILPDNPQPSVAPKPASSSSSTPRAGPVNVKTSAKTKKIKTEHSDGAPVATKIKLKRDGAGNFVCPVVDCDFKHGILKSMAKHMSLAHMKVKPPPQERPPESLLNELPIEVCNTCGKIVLRERMASHLLSHHDGSGGEVGQDGDGVKRRRRRRFLPATKKPPRKISSFVCITCSAKYRLKKEMRVHLFQEHGMQKDQVGQCMTCFSIMGNKEIIANHESACNNAPPPVTIKYYGRRKNVTTDIKVPWNPKAPPKECPVMGCCYVSDGHARLRQHYIANHMKQECPHCKKQIGVFHMERHIHINHLKKYNHTCDICSAGFHSQHDLTYHMDEIHIREVKFKCQICGEGFFSKKKMQNHNLKQHVHKDEFRCDPCGKVYNHKKSLEKHLTKVHQGIGLDKLLKRSAYEVLVGREMNIAP